jgi:hypothetical protein
MTIPEARPEAVAVTEEMVEAMAEALFFAEKWTDHDCRWADIVAEAGTPTRAVVQHFREKATRVLSRFSPLAKKAASTSLWSILDEVREFFPPSDESVGFMPFEDWKLRASKAAAQVRSAQDHGGEANEMIGEVERLRAATMGMVDGYAGIVRGLDTRLAAAEARVAKAVEVLREVEWAGTGRFSGSAPAPACPSCGGFKAPGINMHPDIVGHVSDCALATLLSDHPAPEPGVEAGEVRNAALEAAAKVAEGEVYEERYRTWSFWPEIDGGRSNAHRQTDLVKHSDQIAAAIRALQPPADGGRDGK